MMNQCDNKCSMKVFLIHISLSITEFKNEDDSFYVI